MNRWLDDLRQLDDRGEPAVMVTVAGVRGSAPREIGARMIVTARQTIGSIGGGQLEYSCARVAFEMLNDGAEAATSLRRFPLGASMGQCCGGVVDVLFEPTAALPAEFRDSLLRLHECREPFVIMSGETGKALLTDGGEMHGISFGPDVVSRAQSMLARKESAAISLNETGSAILLEPVLGSGHNIAVFGAGHVGTAVVQILADTDCNIRWIDSRRRIFPARLADNVMTIESSNPDGEVAAVPPGACYLVMTHSHALDFDIVSRILERSDFEYCGLIGSRTKRRRFENRLRQLGVSQAGLSRLTCPIGIEGIDGKSPQEIAIGVAAELMLLRSSRADIRGGRLHLVGREQP